MTAPNQDGVDALSKLTAGNDHLVTEPGLVLALQQGNATPAQAGAINQFLGGLKAELAVRNAVASGTQISLSQQEQHQLDAMGVDYQGVVAQTPHPAVAVANQMAQHGLVPVTDAAGNIVTNSSGDVISKKAPVDGGVLLLNDSAGALAHNDAATAKSSAAQLQTDFAADNRKPGLLQQAGDALAGAGAAVWNAVSPSGLEATTGHNYSDTTELANGGYNIVASSLSQSHNDVYGNLEHGQGNMGGLPSVEQAAQQSALMTRLGYDPNSVMDNLAFKAKGYTFNDASSVAARWNTEFPNGVNGWDGNKAVSEAQAFLDDPTQYEQRLAQQYRDGSLNAAQYAAQTQFINSDAFQTLVRRVVADKASVGTDIARGMGIDPVNDPSSFKQISTIGDVAASFLIDPLSVGLSAYTGYQRTSVALKNLTDSEGITHILTAVNPTAAQARAQSSVRQIVDLANQYREALAAGDRVALAKIQAKASQNDLGALLGDFVGHDQLMAVNVTSKAGKTSTRTIYGNAEPIDTYDKAVQYIASKNALLRLYSGRAPIESSVMPGALSSFGYSKVKGSLLAFGAGKSLARTERDVQTVLARATEDGGFRETLLNDGQLRRVLPAQDDAIDFLTGDVIAAKEAVANATGKASLKAANDNLASAQRALTQRQAELEAKSPLEVTDKGLGTIRRNRLDFGKPIAPEGISDVLAAKNAGKDITLAQRAKLGLFGQLGTIERAKVVAARFSNWLPRDLTVNVSDASSAEEVRRAARGFLSAGDSQILSALWAGGSLETRKAIVQGLREQVLHAAGLTRTRRGQELLKELQASPQKYTALDGGKWFTDRNGAEIGMYPGQMRYEFTLPNFGAIQKASAKIGLYESTIGRFLASKPVELFNSAWRTLVLGVPVTATRAIAESYLNAAARQDMSVKEALATKYVLKRLGRMESEGLRRSKVSEMIAGMVERSMTFGDVHDMLDRLALKTLGDAKMNALANWHEGALEARLVRLSRDHWLNAIDPSRAAISKEIASLGLQAREIRYATSKAFDPAMHHLDGYQLLDAEKGADIGIDNVALTLATRVNDAPDVAKALFARMEDPKRYSLDHIVRALESGDTHRLMNDSSFGRVFFDNFGRQQEAVTPEEIALGKRQWAQGMVDDMVQVMHGRNGTYLKNVADYVREHGRAPSSDWLRKNLRPMDIPSRAIAPNYEAVIPGLADGKGVAEKAVDALIESTGKVYQWAVERLIQRNSTGPLYALSYANERVALDAYKESLVAGGLADDVAEEAVQNMAERRAWDNIALMVDDPALKSQMDVVGRSFFAFSRATTVMLRRWGKTLYRNPAAARKAQLIAEGAVHSGLVYQDQNGQWMMAIPMSGVAQEAIYNALSIIPGLKDLARFPVSNFTGQITSVIPGSTNPFQYNTTPLVSISMRAVASLFPNDRLIFDAIDRKLNGSQGQGQDLVSTLLPRALKMARDNDVSLGVPGGPTLDVGKAFGGEDRNSVLTSAVVGALYNMAVNNFQVKQTANGEVVTSTSDLPPDSQMLAALRQQELLGTLQQQTKSVLFTRFLLGLVSPMTVSSPTDAIDQKAADPAYAARGAQSLKDEYKMIVNDVGDFAKANAVWNMIHPEATVYEQSSSQLTSNSADIPPTQEAYDWLATNSEFVKKYKNLAAYFVPSDPGKFSMEAYRAELEQGFRERKTPLEFLIGTYVAGGGAVYYANEATMQNDLAKVKAQRDLAVATAKRNGQPVTAAGQQWQDQMDQINAQWKGWSDQFKATHPVFAQHLTSFATNAAGADQQLADLKLMIQNGDVPGDTQQKAAVAEMVDQWDRYKTFVADHTSTQDKTWAKQNLQTIFNEIVTNNPGLRDLYDGVFRPLNTSLTYLGQTGGTP